MTLKVTSPAFTSGTRIPARYTGEGDDVSPALSWGTPPPGTKEICILCEDPDAPRPKPWVHWMVARIPGETSGLPEGAGDGLIVGHNDFGDESYGGPMPPRGHGPHRYIFKVMALSRPTGLHGGFSKDELIAATRGHVLAEGELIGVYERK